MRFISNCDINIYDIEFKEGVATDVDDAFVINKLKGNSHFKKATTRRKKAKKPSGILATIRDKFNL